MPRISVSTSPSSFIGIQLPGRVKNGMGRLKRGGVHFDRAFNMYDVTDIRVGNWLTYVQPHAMH